MGEVVDAEVVDEVPAVRCRLCGATAGDAGLVGRRCGSTAGGQAPCHGRWLPVGTAVAVPEPAPAQRAADGPAVDERPLSDGARRLVLAGIPQNTREAYERMWKPFDSWCEERDLASRPAAESTMIEYLESWDRLPVHNRCAGGRQQDGTACSGHRPAPPSMWVWYSAVRFYHAMPSPPYPWHGGKRLALAMGGYRTRAVRAGWKANKAPRAWPQHVMAMVDVLDPTNPKDVRDRAIILVGWYTAARASDLATYRIGDVARTPLGIDLALTESKTNKAVGKLVERRVLRPDLADPRYCAVTALDAWLRLLRDRFGLTQGALFRPFAKPGKNTPHAPLLRGHRDDAGYRMDSVSVSAVVAQVAERAGVPGGEYFTCHSLRRGRATQLRGLRVDSLAIARAHGWVDGSTALFAYLDEADAFDDEAPAALGMLAAADGSVGIGVAAPESAD